MKISQTLTQFLINHLEDHPEQKDLVLVMSDLASIGKILSYQINKAGILDIFGTTGSINATSDEVKKFDVIANDLCKNFLKQTNHFAALASEEEDGIVEMHQFGKDAKYIIAFDPIDGSSNIDVNIGIGTIFSIHKKIDTLPINDEKQFFQAGKEQVGAGYILYGTSTIMVFSFGNQVHEFTLDQGFGEFLLSRKNISIPENSDTYSVNEANLKYFQDYDRKFIEQLKSQPGSSARYVGSLVADFHRNLIKGGIFMYPAVDKKGSGEYTGKLRLTHELKALAYIAENAGGAAVDGEQDILDIIPSKLHQRTPVIIGNKNIVDNYKNNK